MELTMFEHTDAKRSMYDALIHLTNVTLSKLTDNTEFTLARDVNSVDVMLKQLPYESLTFEWLTDALQQMAYDLSQLKSLE